MAFNNTPAAVHYDQYLTSFATNYYVEQNYLAGRVFPVIDVAKQSDKYYVFNAEEENREFDGLVTKWAPMSEPNMFELTQSEDSYFSEEYHAGFTIDSETAANEDEMLRTRQRKARILMDNMLKKRDRDWIATYLTTGVWGQDLTGVASGPSTNQFVKWSEATSTPLDDVQKWKEDFEIRNYGLMPNKIVLTRDIRRHLLKNTQLLGRINGGATIASPAMVNDSLIASIFDVDEIIWADAVSNKAKQGEAENAARMVTNRMLMVHSPSETGIDVASAGAIFAWNRVPGFNYGISAQTISGTEELRWLGIEEKSKLNMCYDMRVTGSSLGTYVSGII
jgi:hypothetical protein